MSVSVTTSPPAASARAGPAPANRHIKGALGASALLIARQKDTFLAARYRRLARTRGKQKALVATERTLLTIIWTMLTTGALYDDPGPDWHTRHDPERAKRRAINQLRDVTRVHQSGNGPPDLALSGGLALNPWSQLTLTDREPPAPD